MGENTNTGSTIYFNEKDNKWDYAPRDYYQIISDPTHYDKITDEETKLIYKDIIPDEKLLNNCSLKTA